MPVIPIGRHARWSHISTPKWSRCPSSSLYGSAALNGIINFRIQPGAKPEPMPLFHDQLPEPQGWKVQMVGDTLFPHCLNLRVLPTPKLNKTDLTVHGYFWQAAILRKTETYETRGRMGFNIKHALSDRTFLGVNSLINVLESSIFSYGWNATPMVFTNHLPEPFRPDVGIPTKHRPLSSTIKKWSQTQTQCTVFLYQQQQ